MCITLTNLSGTEIPDIALEEAKKVLGNKLGRNLDEVPFFQTDNQPGNWSVSLIDPKFNKSFHKHIAGLIKIGIYETATLVYENEINANEIADDDVRMFTDYSQVLISFSSSNFTGKLPSISPFQQMTKNILGLKGRPLPRYVRSPNPEMLHKKEECFIVELHTETEPGTLFSQKSHVFWINRCDKNGAKIN